MAIKFKAPSHGWQQVGAEAVVYQELGKRITLALLDEDARNHVQVVKQYMMQ